MYMVRGNQTYHRRKMQRTFYHKCPLRFLNKDTLCNVLYDAQKFWQRGPAVYYFRTLSWFFRDHKYYPVLSRIGSAFWYWAGMKGYYYDMKI